MPPAIVAAGVGLAGAGASAAGGKKASNAQKQAIQLQRDQLNFGKQLVNTGMTAWQPAKDYWSALLQGGPAATTAVGPYAAQIRQQGTGATRAISSMLPQGGEKNLALAGTVGNTYSNIQRLTQGVQPTAAQALGGLSGIPISAGTAATGEGVSLTPSLLQNQQATKAGNAAGAQGLGTLLYNAINKPKNSTIPGTIGTPPFFPLSQPSSVLFPSVGAPA